MSLDTHPIDHLIHCLEKRLPTDPATPITDRVRHRLADIATLRFLERGGEHVGTFERRNGMRWNDAFVRATRKELHACLDRRAERFQRVFTPKAHRAKPKRRSHGAMRFDGFIVSPDRVPGVLLAKTGLIDPEELSGLQRDHVGRLVIKHDLIPSVQLMCENTEIIGESKGRMLRIDAPDRESIDYYEGSAKPVAASSVGAILYVRGVVGGDDEEEDQQVMYFDNAYDMLRKTFHAQSAYDDEIDGLASCLSELDSIRAKLNTGYRRETPDDVKRLLWARTESVIARSEKLLRPSIDNGKREAHGFLEKAPMNRTSTGKPAVTPTMTQITAAIDRIEARLGEIREKGGINAEDRITMHEEIRADEATVLSTRYEVTDLANALDDGTVGPAEIRRVLELRLDDVRGVRLRPLSVFAHAMATVIEALDPDDPELFREQLLRIHTIGKAQGIRTSAERIRGNAAKNGFVHFAGEALTAEHVERAVRTEQIFPGLTVDNLEHVMEPLADRWTGILALLKKYAKTPPMDPAQAHEELEDLLDALGTENAAQAMASWLPEAISQETPHSLTIMK